MRENHFLKENGYYDEECAHEGSYGAHKGGANVNLDKCQILSFPKITDERGNLSFIEERKHVPFDIKRIYYMSSIPNGSTRGGHANPATEHVIIALNGQFTVRLRENITEKSFVLNRADCGLYIPEGIWHRIEDVSQGSIVLVLASTLYDEKDYTKN